MEDVYTIADLARKTGLTQAKVKNALKGVEPALTVSDGYYKLYSLPILRAQLMSQNRDLLVALGFLSPFAEEEPEQPHPLDAEVSA